MAHQNAFALLGDEEGDDISTFLSRLAAKGGDSSSPAAKRTNEEQHGKKTQCQSAAAGLLFSASRPPLTEYAGSERMRGRGGSGSRSSIGNKMESFENGQEKRHGQNYVCQRNNGAAQGYQRSDGAANRYPYNNGGSGYQMSYEGANGNHRSNGGFKGYPRNYKVADGGHNNGYQQYRGEDYAEGVDDGNWQEWGRGWGRRGGGRGRRWGRVGELNGNHAQILEVNRGKNIEQEGDSGGGWEKVSRNGNRSHGSQRSLYGGGNQIFKTPNRGTCSGRNGMHEANTDSQIERSFGDGRGQAYNSDGEERDVPSATALAKDEDVTVIDNDAPATTELASDLETEQRKSDEIAAQENSKNKDLEEDNNEMTLVEYEKLLLEKRKALDTLKTEERKVTLDKDFELMQLVEKKKEDLSVKLKSGNDKLKRKDVLDKDERTRKLESLQRSLGEMFARDTGHVRRRDEQGGYGRGNLQPLAADWSSGGRAGCRGRGNERGGNKVGNSPRQAADSATGNQVAHRDGHGRCDEQDSSRQDTAGEIGRRLQEPGSSSGAPARARRKESFSRPRVAAIPAIEDPVQFPDLSKAVKV